MVKIDILPKICYNNNRRQWCRTFKIALRRGQKMLILAIIILTIYAIVASAADYYKYKMCESLKKDNEELNAQYHTFYRNVERAHGYCAARQAARQPGYEAQMFSIESTTTAPKGTKSIEVF